MEYRGGKKVIGSERYTGSGTLEKFLELKSSELVQVHFQPSPPSREHWLGTTAQGYDVVSYLYGGLAGELSGGARLHSLRVCPWGDDWSFNGISLAEPSI